MLASYVHGAYIDDVVTMRRAVPQGGTPADWFFHSDDQFSVSAVTNAAGALAERVAYGDFGAPTFFTPGGTAMVASAIGNPYAFTGRRWDAAERTYHYRFRTFSPGLGRFTTRDPIGIWGDALNLGNGYAYTGNDPWTWVDPWGEEGGEAVGSGSNYEFAHLAEFRACETQKIASVNLAGAHAEAVFQHGDYASRTVATSSIFLATLLIPGPEDIVFAGVVYRAGRIIGRVASTAKGYRIAKSLDEVAGVGFRSRGALRRYWVKHFGDIPKGHELHHIVEQSQIKKRAKFAAEQVHNTSNVVVVPKEVNKELNKYYSQIHKFTEGKTLRDWLGDKDFEYQFKFGMRRLEIAMKDFEKKNRPCP